MVYVRLERATANEQPHDLGEKIKEIDVNFEKVHTHPPAIILSRTFLRKSSATVEKV